MSSMGHYVTDSFWSGLHCASYFGLVEVVADLIYMGCYDLDGAARLGSTPLFLAAEQGHEEVVKMLLGHEEVNPEKPDCDGWTPLLSAAEQGHEEVVKMLLGREDVNPNKPNNDLQTPLALAASYGHEGVVKMLLGSVRKRPGWPADNRPAFSPARPGLCETDLGFVGQALGKPAGFMGAWRRRQAFGIFHVRSQYFVVVWVISEDARRYLKILSDTPRYLKMPADV